MNNSANSELNEACGLHRAGQFSEAASRYRQILRAQPGNSQALYLLGFLHFQRGEFQDAERLMGEALALNPSALDALYNRARALMKLRRPEDALPLFDRLLSLNPKIAEAWHSRAMALSALGRPEKALASCDKALAISPASQTLNSRANLLASLRRFEEAAAGYEALHAGDPNFSYALGNLAFSRLQCCDWRGYNELRHNIAEGVRAGARVAEPGTMLVLSDCPQDQMRAAEISIGNEVPAETPQWKARNFGHERKRIAYISADFFSHPTAYLMAGVIEAHDRGRFEIVLISFGPDDGSAIRRRIEEGCERFIDVRDRSDADIADLLRTLEIDIAVDLMGLTGGSRMGVFAWRVAPVQVSYLGFPGTTGAPYMDYLMADRVVIPPEDTGYYREKIVWLPEHYQANDSKRRVSEHTPSRAEAGLPESAFVFCCLNNNHKIAPEFFDIWMNLLRQVDGSVLWLLHDNVGAACNLRREATARRVAPERLVFAPRAEPADHLARQRLADLFLDTIPYNAHTTASDALWVGLPVVTTPGRSFAGRVASSLLRAAGVPELIAPSLLAYEALALGLARDPAALSILKAKLAKNRDTCALFDTLRFTRDLEDAYIAMQERPGV